MPTHAEVLCNVPDGGTLDSRADVVPAHARTRRMVIGVVAVARLRGDIDAADKRDAVVDHDRLFVVAVQGPFLRVERAFDLAVSDQPVSHLPNVVP